MIIRCCDCNKFFIDGEWIHREGLHPISKGREIINKAINDRKVSDGLCPICTNIKINYITRELDKFDNMYKTYM